MINKHPMTLQDLSPGALYRLRMLAKLLAAHEAVPFHYLSARELAQRTAGVSRPPDTFRCIKALQDMRNAGLVQAVQGHGWCLTGSGVHALLEPLDNGQ